MTSALPLSGLKVLDLSRVLAGPYCTQMLGDLGADVIKVEHPDGGDDTRAWGPPYLDGQSAYYLSANRNKRSVALDFADPAQRDRVLALAAEADVLVQNFKSGGLVKYGLDYDSLKGRFPRLVYCGITGFGESGPYAHRPGYDALIQAMGGLMSITGPDATRPTKVGVAVADITAGLHAAVAILAALRERDRSGLGQRIEISLFDVQVSWLTAIAMNYLVAGAVPVPMGNAHPNLAPYESFLAADHPMMLAVGNDEQFARLCGVLGTGWAQDDRFRTNDARVRNRAVLVPLVSGALRRKPRAEWLAALERVGVPAGPINTLDDLRNDPHALARELFTVMDDGRTPCLRSPLRFSRTPLEEPRRPPRLDEHPDAGWLGTGG